MTKSENRYYIHPNDRPRRMVQTVQTSLRSLLLPQTSPPTFIKFIAFVLLLLNLLIMQIAHVFYMIKHITDVANMADTCATVSTTFQGIVKLISMYFNSNNIRWMCRKIYAEFWTIDVVPLKVKAPLTALAKYSEILMISFYVLIFFCCTLLLIPPLLLGEKNLPLASIYPFDWSRKPIYEIMYVWQWIINLYGVCFVVGTHDFLFVAMMVQLIVQFKILQYVLTQIGTNEENKLYKLLTLSTKSRNSRYTTHEDDSLLIFCVEHHIRLLDFADVVEKTFSPIVFSQFVESVSGLCLGVFLLNLVDGVMFLKLIFFVIGHLAQLLLYCLFGNEVMYQSVRVSDAAFDSSWHLKYKSSIRAGLTMVIQRAQRSKKITALGMADLNILSFIEVIRSSISFSTLLKTVIEKQKDDIVL